MKKEIKQQVKNEVLGLNEKLLNIFNNLEACKDRNFKNITETKNNIEKLNYLHEPEYIRKNWNKESKHFNNEYSNLLETEKNFYNTLKIEELITKYYNEAMKKLNYLIAYEIEMLLHKYCETSRDFNDFEKIVKEELKENLFFRYYTSISQNYICIFNVSKNNGCSYDNIKYYTRLFKDEWNGLKFVETFGKHNLTTEYIENVNAKIKETSLFLNNININLISLRSHFKEMLKLQEKQEKELQEFKNKQKEEINQKDIFNVWGLLD